MLNAIFQIVLIIVILVSFIPLLFWVTYMIHSHFSGHDWHSDPTGNHRVCMKCGHCQSKSPTSNWSGAAKVKCRRI